MLEPEKYSLRFTHSSSYAQNIWLVCGSDLTPRMRSETITRLRHDTIVLSYQLEDTSQLDNFLWQRVS